MLKFPFFILIFVVLAGCATTQKNAVVLLSDRDTLIATKIGLEPMHLQKILDKQIYQMNPFEAGRYIAYMQLSQTNFKARVAAIGRKNIGQPYTLNLLGEYPFQLHDNLPMFNLARSDCVVFAEHTYAMALSKSWEEFFWMLQRIRYKDGVVGVASRNHYTEQDWDINNQWLVTDITRSLAGENGPSYVMRVDRTNFLKTRHHTESTIPIQISTEYYLDKQQVASIAGQLQEGDFVNVISTKNGEYWASHVGIVVVAPDGKRNFLNSTEPQVREEGFDTFLARAAEREERQAKAGKVSQKLAGFKFLRLNDTVVVPPAAPQPRPGY